MKKNILVAMVLIFASSTLYAQDKGRWGIMPKMSLYTNSGTIVGIGVAARYSINRHIRLEPAITALLHNGCSIDVSCDAQYLFKLANHFKIYPLVGISANEINKWAVGLNLGGGVDYSISNSWDLTAGVKWQPVFNNSRSNPIIISLGGCFNF